MEQNRHEIAFINPVSLDCSSHNFNELDVSFNTKLERLNCQINNITSLDLSKNHNLKYVNIRFNPIEQNNIKFPNQNNIEELYIDETQISELDLSNFGNIRKLQVGSLSILNIDKCINLMSLTLIKTKLKSLDISNSQSLSDFSIWEGKVENLTCNEFQAFIFPSISKKLKLRPTLEQKNIIQSFKLHTKALSHNWDDGLSKLKRILKNKNCEQATALAIFWMSGANFHLQFNKVSDVPDHAKETFRFLNKLEKQLMENQFPKNSISFNPKNHFDNDWTVENLDQTDGLRKIDNTLKEKVIGKNSDFFDYEKKINLKNIVN